MTKQLLLVLAACLLCVAVASAQGVPTYNPEGQPQDMQYFKPIEDNQFVGDCIPFAHDGTVYLYWLLDEGHHSAMNHLGGHQWCLSTTTDLVHWKHYPIVIGIDEDWEKSICTGSVVEHGGLFYAFYATRMSDGNGGKNESLSYAVSKDGIVFEKQKPNPFYSYAPGYSKKQFRDAKAIVDENGVFHLFVTSRKENYVMEDAQGCLVHLTSRDLKNWTVEGPLIAGVKNAPECPDYFEWNGWYYLVFSQHGETWYLKSRQPFGPWEYPSSQALVEKWVRVAKTFPFEGGRRIEAGWIPSRKDNKDNGKYLFGGNMVFRELVQLPDGNLGTRWPEELMPHPKRNLDLVPLPKENCTVLKSGAVSVNAKGDAGSAVLSGLPRNCRISMTIEPEGNCYEYGIALRSSVDNADGYRLKFSPNARKAFLADTSIEAVESLGDRVSLEIIMKDDFIDVCINGARCMVNRLPEKNGNGLWLYAKSGDVLFKDIVVKPLDN